MHEYPVEPKVKAATAASYFVTLVLVAVANAVQDQDVALLLGFAPQWLESVLLPLVPALGALLAGYVARHQHRRKLTLDDLGQ